MRAYLQNRKQVVNVGGTMSKPGTVTCGVPQGSILGPLLFLVYVNDMKSAVNCDLLLYADDSALLVLDKNIGVVEQTLSQELHNVSEWLIDNKLSLHLGKTESILFGSKCKLKGKQLTVICNGTEINAKESVNYLGMEIDNAVSGEMMAEKVIKKVTARIKFLSRISKFLNTETLKMLGSALVQCHMDYACIAWFSGLTKRTGSRIQVCQNKLMRLVLNLPARTHLDASHFNRLKWLPVEKKSNAIKNVTCT